MTRAELQQAMEEILEVPNGALKDSDSRDTIETWSSLADVKILSYISSESGADPDPELMEAETFGELVRKLEEKRVLA
jgi:acyl carrier protein